MTRIRPTPIPPNSSIPLLRPTTTSCPPTARSPANTIPRSTSAPSATITRGRWTNNAAEPHPSSQYNMLLGAVGELASGRAPYRRAPMPPASPTSVRMPHANQTLRQHVQIRAALLIRVTALRWQRITVSSNAISRLIRHRLNFCDNFGDNSDRPILNEIQQGKI